MSWHVRCFEEDDPLCFILMHLFRVLHSRLDVNLPHAQAWMSHIHIHDSVQRYHGCGWSCHHDHISTTCWWYLPAKYRSDKLLATHSFLIMDDVSGMKSLGGGFYVSISNIFGKRRSALAQVRWVALGPGCPPWVCLSLQWTKRIWNDQASNHQKREKKTKA